MSKNLTQAIKHHRHSADCDGCLHYHADKTGSYVICIGSDSMPEEVWAMIKSRGYYDIQSNAQATDLIEKALWIGEADLEGYSSTNHWNCVIPQDWPEDVKSLFSGDIAKLSTRDFIAFKVHVHNIHYGE